MQRRCQRGWHRTARGFGALAAAQKLRAPAGRSDAWTFLVDLDGCQMRRLSVDSGFFASADWARRLNDQLRRALEDAGQRRVALSGKGLRIE